jgi:hypothetical protein
MVRCLVIFTLFCFVTVAEVNPSSLYERIGRYNAISQIVDEYLKGIRSDPQFARFFGARLRFPDKGEAAPEGSALLPYRRPLRAHWP